jgi:hypothetical protein
MPYKFWTAFKCVNRLQLYLLRIMQSSARAQKMTFRGKSFNVQALLAAAGAGATCFLPPAPFSQSAQFYFLAI